MRNWDMRDEVGHCKNDEDCEYATKVCKALDIPFYEVYIYIQYTHNLYLINHSALLLLEDTNLILMYNTVNYRVVQLNWD